MGKNDKPATPARRLAAQIRKDSGGKSDGGAATAKIVRTVLKGRQNK